MKVSLENIRKSFGAVEVVKGLDLDIADGEFLVLLGPSGCGKTTALRMVAGLESATSGRILIGERDVTNVLPKYRDVAMVFQSYALYPHMTIAENIGYPLKLRGHMRSELKRLQSDLGVTTIYVTHDQVEAMTLAHRVAIMNRGIVQQIATPREIYDDPSNLFVAGFIGSPPMNLLEGELRLRHAAQLQGIADVLGDRHVRVERIGLEDHRHVAVLRQHVGDVALADQHAPGGDRFEAGDHAERGGLAAAGGAEQGEEFTGPDGEVQSVEGDGRAELPPQSPEFDGGGLFERGEGHGHPREAEAVRERPPKTASARSSAQVTNRLSTETATDIWACEPPTL